MALRIKITLVLLATLLMSSELYSEIYPTNRVLGYYGAISYILSLDRAGDRDLRYKSFESMAENPQIYMNSCPANEQYVREHGGMEGIKQEVREFALRYSNDLKLSYDHSLKVWPYILLCLCVVIIGTIFATYFFD